MQIESIINGENSAKIMVDILNEIHTEGPISLRNFETLSYIKKFHPEVFEKYESKLISLMGLFYKTKKPQSLLEQVYEIFAENIEETFGVRFTPVQADANRSIKDSVYFSFSAPTSAGKSFLFKNLIKNAKKDIVIIVPSRALISEYIATLTRLVPKSVLILQFIEVINIKNTTRRIYVITPERGTDLFKNLDKLDIELFLFDEAQLSDDGIRGMKFDSFVRRADKSLPEAKKVFTHPFIDNPEAQLTKHGFLHNSDSKLYKQNSVGKIYLSHEDGRYLYFSPFEEGKEKTLINTNEDIVKKILNENGTVLIYLSKSKIYSGNFLIEFSEYTNLCSKLNNPNATKYIDKLKEFIGASDTDDDRHSLLIDMMERGIVVHHGSMPLKARLLIEEFVNQGFAKICFSTSTLSQGVNMPFDIVWVNYFTFQGTTSQKILDLKNLIGRAGRSTEKTSSFDYGYVILERKNIATFSQRLMAPSKILNVSKLDEPITDIKEDDIDVVEAIKNNTFNDYLQLTENQVQRIQEADIDSDVLFILDNLIVEGEAISSSKYYELENADREKIKDSFKKLYVAHLRRKELSPAEYSVLSASIPILLWQIQGKSFSEIISHRYAYLSRKNERDAIMRRLKRNEITEVEAKKEITKLKIRFSQIAEPLPSTRIKKPVSLYTENTSVDHLEYDILVYDTYDYIDKVLGLSLRDPLSAVFLAYFEKTKDVRAVQMSNYIKYGTNDNKEIWLNKYGFSFDDIEWIKEHVHDISEQEIIFKESIKEVGLERLEVVERFMNNYELE